jgi:hypothetical protein
MPHRNAGATYAPSNKILRVTAVAGQCHIVIVGCCNAFAANLEPSLRDSVIGLAGRQDFAETADADHIKSNVRYILASVYRICIGVRLEPCQSHYF